MFIFYGECFIWNLGFRSKSQEKWMKESFLKMAQVLIGREQLRAIIHDIQTERAQGNRKYRYRFYGGAGQGLDGEYDSETKDIHVEVEGKTKNKVGCILLHESLHKRQDKNEVMERMLHSNDAHTIRQCKILVDAETQALDAQLAIELEDQKIMKRNQLEGYAKLYAENLKKYGGNIKKASYETRQLFVRDFIKPLNEPVHIDYGNLDMRVSYASESFCLSKEVSGEGDKEPLKEFKDGIQSRFPEIPRRELDNTNGIENWPKMKTLLASENVSAYDIENYCAEVQGQANILGFYSVQIAKGKKDNEILKKWREDAKKEWQDKTGLKLPERNVSGKKVVQNMPNRAGLLGTLSSNSQVVQSDTAADSSLSTALKAQKDERVA